MNTIVQQLRDAINAKHTEALRAVETVAAYLEEPVAENGTTPPKKTVSHRRPPSRKGTGTIRNTVLPVFSQDFIAVDDVATKTGLTRLQVRGVLTSPGLKSQFAKKVIDGVVHYKFEGEESE